MKTITILLLTFVISAGAQAKGILEFAYGYNYCNCLPVNDTSLWKSAPAAPISKEYESGLFIEAVPNPARSWVAFNYTLPVFINEALLEITDVKGNRIASFVVEQGFEQQVWDIRKVKPGVYIYTLKYGSVTVSGKLIIK